MPKRTVGGEGKKSPLNMRTTPDLRRRLEKAAAASGRSLVQETEFRLEKSFAEEELGRTAVLSPDSFQLAGQIAQAAALADALTNDKWIKPGIARQVLRAAINELIEPTEAASREKATRQRSLLEAVQIISGEKAEFEKIRPEDLGRNIADAISRPRMGSILNAGESEGS